MPTRDEIVNEAVAKQLTIKDNFIAHYLAETGAKVSETTLVEQRKDFKTTLYWCEPKPRLDLSITEMEVGDLRWQLAYVDFWPAVQKPSAGNMKDRPATLIWVDEEDWNKFIKRGRS